MTATRRTLRRRRLRQRDQRLVYGARCTWWDSIRAASATSTGLPCCPFCGGVLFEVPSQREWWAGVDRYEAAGRPGYRVFVEWLRGRCFSGMDAALAAYPGGSA